MHTVQREACTILNAGTHIVFTTQPLNKQPSPVGTHHMTMPCFEPFLYSNRHLNSGLAASEARGGSNPLSKRRTKCSETTLKSPPFDVGTKKSCPFRAGVLCALAAPPLTVKHPTAPGDCSQKSRVQSRARSKLACCYLLCASCSCVQACDESEVGAGRHTSASTCVG